MCSKSEQECHPTKHGTGLFLSVVSVQPSSGTCSDLGSDFNKRDRVCRYMTGGVRGSSMIVEGWTT